MCDKRSPAPKKNPEMRGPTTGTSKSLDPAKLKSALSFIASFEIQNSYQHLMLSL